MKIRFISVISGKVLVFVPFRYHFFVMTSATLTLAQKASRLLELHHASQPLVLINAWDAASAAMVEHCGLPAIATSSAAMANALGFPDGQYIPWSQMLDAVARVCRAVKVPVTADIESGFAPDVTALETSITQIIQAGAVGVNLEDLMPSQSENVRHGSPLFPLPEQIARIQAARRAAHAAGIHLVINARTDAYWQAGVDPAEAMRNTLERGKAYLQAGADCIFIPGLRNPDHIKTVIDHLRANPRLFIREARDQYSGWSGCPVDSRTRQARSQARELRLRPASRSHGPAPPHRRRSQNLRNIQGADRRRSAV